MTAEADMRALAELARDLLAGHLAPLNALRYLSTKRGRIVGKALANLGESLAYERYKHKETKTRAAGIENGLRDDIQALTDAATSQESKATMKKEPIRQVHRLLTDREEGPLEQGLLDLKAGDTFRLEPADRNDTCCPTYWMKAMGDGYMVPRDPTQDGSPSKVQTIHDQPAPRTLRGKRQRAKKANEQ